MDKIYLVWQGEYSDKCIIGIFKDKSKADKYAELQSKLDYHDEAWVDEQEFDDDRVDMNARVVDYYYAIINLNTGKIESDDELDYNETTPQIYTKDSYYKIYDYENGKEMFVYSIHSYEHAKKIAIEQYQIYTQQKLEDGEL